MFNDKLRLWIVFIVALQTQLINAQQMECKYGERGSLTVYCFNATSDYFKASRYRYDHLDETLKCLNCNLEPLAGGTFDISGNQIKTVDIQRSNIHVIKPKAFIGLIFMERLLLSYNPIKDIEPGAFVGIRKLKEIELENAVSELKPKIFQELRALEVLKLGNNHLKEIQIGTFEGLHNLRVLELNNNQLSSIGNIFEGLVNLRVLKLNNNYITTIIQKEDEFKDLKHLLALNLENNLLKNFSITFPSDCKLRILRLGYNQLNENGIKPQTFSNLHNLEELHMNDNLFRKISPKFFTGLFHLRIVNLGGNIIEKFSTGSFSGLPYLRVIDLNHNKLEAAKATGKLKLNNLDWLDLSHNEISDFDYISLVARFPKLSHVNLAGNNLSCKVLSAMEVLFGSDNIDYIKSDRPADNLNNCPKQALTADQLLKQLSTEFREEYVNAPSLVWMFVLITLIMILLGISFYIQFFIQYKAQDQTHSFNLMKNLHSFRSERFR